MEQKYSIGNRNLKNKGIRIWETVKVRFSLKWYENNNFVCKRNLLFTQDCKCETAFDELHNIGRLH